MNKKTPKAIIFDMDGLLVHTEPFWVQAQIEILSGLRVHINETTCAQTKGLRIDEVVQHYYNLQPWSGTDIMETALLIAKRVSSLFQEKGELLPGVHHALHIARSLNIPIALASSSPHFLITDLLKHSNISSFFDLIVSAQDDAFGKPHPAVYIRTAQLLGLPATECMAIEDSFFGVLAAKSARMSCIVVPEHPHPQWIIADHCLSSLEDIHIHHFQSLYIDAQ